MSKNFYMRSAFSDVQALQFTGNFDELEQFVGGDAEFRDGRVVVATRQGPLFVLPYEWVVIDGFGNFFTFQPDTFSLLFKSWNPNPIEHDD